LRFALGANHSGNAKRTNRKHRVVISDGGLNKVEQMACFIAQRYAE